MTKSLDGSCVFWADQKCATCGRLSGRSNVCISCEDASLTADKVRAEMAKVRKERAS